MHYKNQCTQIAGLYLFFTQWTTVVKVEYLGLSLSKRQHEKKKSRVVTFVRVSKSSMAYTLVWGKDRVFPAVSVESLILSRCSQGQSPTNAHFIISRIATELAIILLFHNRKMCVTQITCRTEKTMIYTCSINPLFATT